MTQTLNLNKMGLVPMNEFEMTNSEGGNWLWEVAKAVGIDLAAEAVKALGKHVINDWNSRSGAHRTMTDTHAAYPYH